MGRYFLYRLHPLSVREVADPRLPRTDVQPPREVDEEASHALNHASLASKVKVSAPTLHRWIELLKSLFFCFTIQPWSKNLSRSLIKEPKIYLWNWALIDDLGARLENFVASHLHKAVQFWTDSGYGDYGLYYLRDKDKREVDFLVVKNKKPWFLVETKASGRQGVSRWLHEYQEKLRAPHAFQIGFDLPYVHRDCFEMHEPVIVPAKTLLSQLI
jgi:predicted AAA+ superfamily ATPase